jgi:hypothetical protein
MAIATAFFELSSNDLLDEYFYLLDQPETRENSRRAKLILKEIQIREERRQYLEYHFPWG